MKTVTNRRRSEGRLTRAALLCLLALAAMLCQAREAAAQWTAPDAAGNISTTNTGNVGVGTAAPTEKLEVNGTLKATGRVAIGPNGTVNQATYGSTNLTRSLLDAREVITTFAPGTWYFGLVPTLVLNPAVNSSNPAVGVHAEVSTAKGNIYNFNQLLGSISGVSHHGTGTLSSAYGSQLIAMNRSSGILNSAFGAQTIVWNGAGGNMNAGTAVHGWAWNSSTGNITTAVGGRFNVTNNGTGAITTAYGVRIDAATNTAGGGFANNYGLHIADQSAVGSANSFNLYSDGANAKNYFAGSVGVGTTAPAAKLHVAGDIRVDGNINAKYQDVAEWVPSRQQLAAGTVVIVDAGAVNHVLASAAAYDTGVAGVVSGQPGLILGEGGAGKLMVATTGRVKVRVDATRAPIRAGDLLVTSGVAGVAMRSEPVSVAGVSMHRPGTIIGKALESLEKGTGEILVLLSLQ